MLRQGDSKMFKKYSQMKLQMKREALAKINRRANEMAGILAQQISDDRAQAKWDLLTLEVVS